MEVWKIIFLSKWVICRFHVNLPGCIIRYPRLTFVFSWELCFRELGFFSLRSKKNPSTAVAVAGKELLENRALGESCKKHLRGGFQTVLI